MQIELAFLDSGTVIDMGEPTFARGCSMQKHCIVHYAGLVSGKQNPLLAQGLLSCFFELDCNLEQRCPLECSRVVEMSYICVVQYGSHGTHVATEHEKCG